MIAATDSGFQVCVDPTNPGQFLACCGLLELAARLSNGAEGCFAGNLFRVSSGDPLSGVLAALTRHVPDEITELDGGLSVKPLIAPLRLSIDGDHAPLVLDSWMNIGVEKGVVVARANPPWNFWSGQQTSLRIWTSLRSALVEQLKTLPPETSDGLYSLRVPLSGRFGFDPGAAWNALDVGFSPNDQDMGVASSPAVELLAAVGLQRFRPSVERDRESFFYATWEKSLPPLVAAAAASGVTNISPGARFRGRVVSRGSYAALGMSTPL